MLIGLRPWRTFHKGNPRAIAEDKTPVTRAALQRRRMPKPRQIEGIKRQPSVRVKQAYPRARDSSRRRSRLGFSRDRSNITKDKSIRKTKKRSDMSVVA